MGPKRKIQDVTEASAESAAYTLSKNVSITIERFSDKLEELYADDFQNVEQIKHYLRGEIEEKTHEVIKKVYRKLEHAQKAAKALFSETKEEINEMGLPSEDRDMDVNATKFVTNNPLVYSNTILFEDPANTMGGSDEFDDLTHTLRAEITITVSRLELVE